jgi:hypothetical protein
MTWEDRFKFAFHALIVMEGKYEDALTQLALARSEVVHMNQGDQIEKIRERHQVRKLRSEGLSYSQIGRRILQIRGAMAPACNLGR